jgi:hypothetical protein
MKNDYQVIIKFKHVSNIVVEVEATDEKEAIKLVSDKYICPDNIKDFDVKLLKKSSSL